MSVSEVERLGEILPPARQEATVRRPLPKRVMHAVRRLHLYLGLFLLPWAVLYGVTGFLFNHPTAFADAPTASFGKNELAGTPMESSPAPAEVAKQVVVALNGRAKGESYVLVEPEKAKYTRDFAFATVKADGQDVSILFDMNASSGTVRSKQSAPAKPAEKAPFAIAPRVHLSAAPPDALRLDAPLHERVKASVPVVLERTGFPTGEVTVTSVPDVSFLMSDGTQVWRVTYSPMAGSVSAVPADSAPPEELSTRRFLTRLHVAHGFPGSTNTKWFWAVIVDAMALVMVFWGVSGLFMWWQIKPARKLGFVILLVSVAGATALGFGMHEVFTAR